MWRKKVVQSSLKPGPPGWQSEILPTALTSHTCLSGSIGGGIGTRWSKISNDSFTHIDSGPFGIVYAVNTKGDVFARWGITKENPEGVGWDKVPLPGVADRPSPLLSVSCGGFGCWGVLRAGKGIPNVLFRKGVTQQRIKGKNKNEKLETKKH